jgi:hypothetical protein
MQVWVQEQLYGHRVAIGDRGDHPFDEIVHPLVVHCGQWFPGRACPCRPPSPRPQLAVHERAQPRPVVLVETVAACRSAPAGSSAWPPGCRRPPDSVAAPRDPARPPWTSRPFAISSALASRVHQSLFRVAPHALAPFSAHLGRFPALSPARRRASSRPRAARPRRWAAASFAIASALARASIRVFSASRRTPSAVAWASRAMPSALARASPRMRSASLSALATCSSAVRRANTST